MISLLLAVQLVHAQSAFEQALQQESRIKVHESWIKVQESLYRKIDIDDRHYWLAFRPIEPDMIDLYCEPPYEPKSLKVPEYNGQDTTHVSGFARLLRDNCPQDQMHVIHRIPADSNVGFQYIDTKEVHIAPKPAVALKKKSEKSSEKK